MEATEILGWYSCYWKSDCMGHELQAMLEKPGRSKKELEARSSVQVCPRHTAVQLLDSYLFSPASMLGNV